MEEDQDVPMFDLEPLAATVPNYHQLPAMFPPPPKGVQTAFDVDDGFNLAQRTITSSFLPKLSGLEPPVPSCGTPNLVQMVRDWGGAELQEQFGESQTATEETEDTEDAHRPKRQKLIHIPASAEAARKAFMTNVILEQIYICSANIAIAAAKTDDEVMQTEPQTVLKRSRKRYLPKEDSTMAVFDPEVLPWLQCGGGYRVGYFAAICLEYAFAFKRLESFQQFVDTAK
ncbi:uncharacterized protein B0J16DRAFT_402919 [Fusarium flagelliforme]|uniref:uncharacterized protein n=1 Tax=Fusarium flagelliforme TaxID=2675880 RepID=UPI001E8CB4AD|nr:uncharacterized protein B0J16DRAFT_402919 [Fusarium flagelliforme]KAH7179550.1 hypothetical protein B0J16DRAFT_402919 [Fusarium flagelliforme]